MIGFIGAGNMASALMRGMIEGGADPASLTACDISKARMGIAREMGVRTAESIAVLAEASDFVVLAIKPKDCAAALETLRALPFARALLSIAVGWPQEKLAAALPEWGVARAMPNTPALVREGVIAFNENHTVAPDAFERLRGLFSACGRTLVVPESLFDAVVAISGSGPAYAYLFIEALADAGVRQGLPRDMAYTLAAQTLLGAAKMVLETGTHPGALKDAVASPGGTTIEAVYALEKAGFRAAVMDAVDACAQKAARMGK